MCDNCGKPLVHYAKLGEIYESTHVIHKQVGGVFKRMLVCTECLREYEKELETTRENFRRQFGEN